MGGTGILAQPWRVTIFSEKADQKQSTWGKAICLSLGNKWEKVSPENMSSQASSLHIWDSNTDPASFRKSQDKSESSHVLVAQQDVWLKQLSRNKSRYYLKSYILCPRLTEFLPRKPPESWNREISCEVWQKWKKAELGSEEHRTLIYWIKNMN